MIVRIFKSLLAATAIFSLTSTCHADQTAPIPVRPADSGPSLTGQSGQQLAQGILRRRAIPASREGAAPGTASAFSFAVYGDSRSMMYLPYKSRQKEEAIKLMVDMFELVLPEKVVEEVVRRDVKLIYDPAKDEPWSAEPFATVELFGHGK